MIDPDLVPSPLVAAADRPPVAIAPVTPPGRLTGATASLRILAWAARALWQRALGRSNAEADARAARLLLERLGGIWIKVGQLLSLRVDVFSEELCRELARLQDAVPGFPPDVARRIVEEELGVPIADVFDAFEDQPIAAASIGQVHRARLRREGAWVAVKVRRPHVEDVFAAQTAAAGRWARAFDRLGVLPFIEWRQMAWELDRIMREEVDYRVEGAAIGRMRRSLRRHRMYVPEPYPQYSTSRVLVMEFIVGVQMSDYIAAARTDAARVRAWERENDVDPAAVVRRFSLSILRQVLEDNSFHGDLHPGNVVLLRHSRVALLDFGTVGSTDRDYLGRFRHFMEALTRDEFERAADMALMMSGPLPREADIGRAKDEMVRALRAWRLRTTVDSLPYPEKSVDAINVAITKVLIRHRITVDWAFLRIRRALATMDATAQHLYPAANYPRITAAYFRLAARRRLEGRDSPGHTGPQGTNVADWLDAPEPLTTTAGLLVEIQRRQLRAFGKTASRAGAVVRAAARTIASACAALSAVVLFLLLARPGRTGWAAGLDVQIWVVLLALGAIGATSAARVARAFSSGRRESHPRSAAFAGVDGRPVSRSGRR